MVREWPRESFSRHHQYAQERYVTENLDDARFAEAQDLHRRPMQIDEALRQHCSISTRRYFLAVIMDDGSPMTFSGPDRTPEPLIEQFFDMNKYQKVMSRIQSGVSPVVDDGFGLEGNGLYRTSMEYPRSRMYDRRRGHNFDDWDAPSRQVRKRPRARHPVNDDDDVPMTVSTTRRAIKIGHSDEVWNFYEQRFKNCQQTACKLIAKAWVKAVEPKKQSTHPYTGSDEKAPDWWPKPWGPTKEDKVRHKEPDHLYKRERVHLLNHILRMIVEPNAKQHPDIQKLNLNVKKLEEITIEALSGFFADKENPANAKKRPYLNEIFKVARQEERFKNDEIDGTVDVFVMAEDKLPDAFGSENDDGSVAKDDEERETPSAKPATAQGLMTTTGADHNTAAATLHGPPFLSDLPVRGNQYPPAMMQDLAAPEHGFVESSGMPVNSPTAVHGSVGLDMPVASPHDSSRRPSMFNTQAEYTGQTSTAMYGQAWQSGSTAPNTSAVYAFTPQQQSQPQASFVNPAVSMGQNQSYMAQPFDNLSRAGYDPNQAHLFRGGGVADPAVHPPQNYNYIGPDGRAVSGVKVDAAARSSLH